MIAVYKKNSFKKYLLAGLVIISTCFFTKNGFAQGPVQNGTATSTNGLFNVTYNFQDNTCPNQNRGTITINTINGASSDNYIYRWLDNSSKLDNKRDGLSQGEVQVEITEKANSAKKDIVKIVIKSPDVFSIEKEPLVLNRPKCTGGSDGSTNITKVSGGTPPYKYSWKRDVAGGSSPEIGTDINYSGIPGKYILKVTDANGCEKYDFVEIEDAPIYVTQLPTIINNVEYSLNTGIGEITINVSGGTPAPAPNPYIYEWSYRTSLSSPFVVNTAWTRAKETGLPSGYYRVKVTDANGCIAPLQNVTIEPTALLVVAPTSINSTCKSTPNGKIDLNVTGGKGPYTIKWDDLTTTTTNTTRTGLDEGTYTGTITDALGAPRTITAQIITSPTLIDFRPVTKTDNKCFGEKAGTITLNVSGGIAPYRYVLNGVTSAPFAGPTFTIPNLGSRNYTVSIIDAGNCATTAPQSVDILPVKALKFFPDASVFKVRCSNPNSGSIEVFVEGGLPPYTYLWSNDATNNTSKNLSIPAGTYSLKVTDALLCELNYTTIVGVEAPAITLSESALIGRHVDNICFLNTDLTPQKNGKATIEITGGSPPFVATWLFEGQPILPLTDIDPQLRSISVANLASGTYTLLIKDDIGCEPLPFTLKIEPIKQMNSNPKVVSQKCVGVNNGSITLEPTGGTQFPLPQAPYRYRWDAPIPAAERGNSTVSSLSPGTYRVRIQDSQGCPLETTINILPAIPVTQLDTVIVKSNTCNGGLPSGSIKITIEGGEPPYTYKWDFADKATGEIVPGALPLAVRLPNQLPQDDLRENLGPGNYVVTVTDKNLCETQLPAPDPLKPEFKTYEVKAISCDQANPNLITDPLMSPNGDGLGNEFFRIGGIEKFPEIGRAHV